MAILTCAFVSLLRNYAKLKKENRLYRKFLEQQYQLESDYLDAYGKLMWESIYASTQARRKTF